MRLFLVSGGAYMMNWAGMGWGAAVLSLIVEKIIDRWGKMAFLVSIE